MAVIDEYHLFLLSRIGAHRRRQLSRRFYCAPENNVRFIQLDERLAGALK